MLVSRDFIVPSWIFGWESMDLKRPRFGAATSYGLAVVEVLQELIDVQDGLPVTLHNFGSISNCGPGAAFIPLFACSNSLGQIPNFVP